MSERSGWYWEASGALPLTTWHDSGMTALLVKAVWEGPPPRVNATYQQLRRLGPWVWPWTYPLGGDQTAAEVAALVAACADGSPERIVLNPELPWRGRSYWDATTYVAQVRAAFPAASVWFSSVPSWGDFPYEGFAAACDGNYPQCYPGYGDQLADEATRGQGKPCIPIVYNAGGGNDPLADATRLLADTRVPIAGVSVWAVSDSRFDGGAGIWRLPDMGSDDGTQRVRSACWSYWTALPDWARGNPAQARWFTADFSSFGETYRAAGLVWEYGALWGDTTATTPTLHAIQPALWPAIFGPGGLARVEGA